MTESILGRLKSAASCGRALRFAVMAGVLLAAASCVAPLAEVKKEEPPVPAAGVAKPGLTPPVAVVPDAPGARSEEEILAEADRRTELLRPMMEQQIASVLPGPFPEPVPAQPKKPKPVKPASVPAPPPVQTAKAEPKPASVEPASVAVAKTAPQSAPAPLGESGDRGTGVTVTGGGAISELSLISRFTTSEGLPNNLVTAVYVDETEAWVGTSGGGVARYLFAEKNWIITGEAEGLISNFVTDVVKFKGRVFVGTKQGISVWDGFAWTSMTEQERVQLLNTTFRVRNGELWVAARNMRGGLLAFDGEKWKDKSTIRTGIVLNNVSTFDFDGNDIWIGTTSRGVYALRGNDWKIYSVTEGITSNFVYTMAVKGGRAYLGGCCGVSYFDGTRWTVYDVPEGLPHSTVNAIAWDGDVVWFGSKNGLAAFDGNEFRNFYAEDGLLAENHVTCLFVRGDELWVGTTGGLSRLKKIY